MTWRIVGRVASFLQVMLPSIGVYLALAEVQTLSAGSHALPFTTTGSLSIIMRGTIPVGRSYDGNSWELTQAGACDGGDCKFAIYCAGTETMPGQCTVTIPDDAHSYRIDQLSGPNVPASAKASRFLTQATFGPTRSTMNAMDATSSSGVRAWIDAQMALPLTSHRAYYRQRVSPRASSAFATGGVRAACSAGSRWHRFALTKVDEGSNLEVAQEHGGYALRISGQLRGDVPAFAPGVGSFRVCYVEERVEGTVYIKQDHASSCGFSSSGSIKWLNPPIQFATADLSATHVLGAADGEVASLGPLHVPVQNVSLLVGSLACTPQYASLARGYLRVDGAYYRHDPRLALLTNTVESPADLSAIAGLDASPATALPRVAKTFLNEATCRPVSLDAVGTSVAYSSAHFHLNTSFLRRMYQASGRLIYYIDNLRLESPYDQTPCSGGSSRWKRLNSGSCASEVFPDSPTRHAHAGLSHPAALA